MTTLLIVDDIELNRMCLGLLLRRQGYRVLEASDGNQALQVTQSEHPDMALVDLFMPEMDGFEYARQVREDKSIAKMPLIFVTSTFSPDAVATLARLLGVRYILKKSSSEEEILAAIRDAASSPIIPIDSTDAKDFNREHGRLVSEKLSSHMRELMETLADYIVDEDPSETDLSLPPGSNP